MGLREVEAAMRDASAGLPKWTSARTIREHDPRRPWPAVPDLKATHLPAIIYHWQQRRGASRDTGPLQRYGQALISSRIDPGVFPWDIQLSYADRHEPVLELMLLADPDAIYRQATVTVSGVTGAFIAGERLDEATGARAYLNAANITGPAGTLDVFEVEPVLYTEDGAVITFSPGQLLTGWQSGAIATVDSTVAIFESLEDLEAEVTRWLRIMGIERLRDAGAEFEEIASVPDLSGLVATDLDAYRASRYEVRLTMIEQVGIIKRNIQTVVTTSRLRDVDGSDLLVQTETFPGTFVKGA